jgi:hypothetical protein
MESEFGTKPGVDITGYRDTFTFGAGRVSVLPCAIFPLFHSVYLEDLPWYKNGRCIQSEYQTLIHSIFLGLIPSSLCTH